MQPLKISIVVPTINRPADLRRCLSALEAQERPADEVIIVIGPGDSLAIDILAEFISRHSNWKYFQEIHYSVVCSLNKGIQASNGDIIALTDDDAAPPPEWLRIIESHYLDDLNVGAVGGRDRLMYNLTHLSNPSPKKLVGRFNWYGMLVGNHHCGVIKSPSDVEVLKGVNLTFRRKAFAKGEIDNYLVGYGAEVGWEIDICLSIRNYGYRIIYDNNAYVEHYSGPRIQGDDRLEIENIHALRRVQNIGFLDAKFQPLPTSLVLLFRSTLIGSRCQPGFLWGLLFLLMGRCKHLGVAFKIMRSYCRGAIDGRSVRLRNQLSRH